MWEAGIRRSDGSPVCLAGSFGAALLATFDPSASVQHYTETELWFNGYPGGGTGAGRGGVECWV